MYYIHHLSGVFQSLLKGNGIAGAALGGAKEAHDAILDMLNLRRQGPSLTYENKTSGQSPPDDKASTGDGSKAQQEQDL